MEHSNTELLEALGRLYVVSDAQERPVDWMPAEEVVSNAEREVAALMGLAMSPDRLGASNG